MEDPSTLSYENLLGIYLEDRRLKGKNTNPPQILRLRERNGVEMTTAGRFYIRKRMYNYAIEWLTRAGTHPQALYTLGLLHMNQRHLAPDSLQKARQYFTVSQTPVACYQLGIIYQDGLGVPKDEQQALHWFVRSALKGLKRSKLQAGLMYLTDARNSRESAKLAYYWLNASINKRRKNNEGAKKLKELIRLVDYDIVSLVHGFDPYKNNPYRKIEKRKIKRARRDHTMDDDDEDEYVDEDEDEEECVYENVDEDEDELDSSYDSDRDIIMQNQSPFHMNINFEAESSAMAASRNTNNNESARIKKLERNNDMYKRTIKQLEEKLRDVRRTRNGRIQKLDEDNRYLRKRITDMENLFRWIAQNDINNH